APGPVRLACVRHAASVRPEPGSNSPMNEESEQLTRTTDVSCVVRITSESNPRAARLTTQRSNGSALHTLDHQFSKSRPQQKLGAQAPMLTRARDPSQGALAVEDTGSRGAPRPAPCWPSTKRCATLRSMEATLPADRRTITDRRAARRGDRREVVVLVPAVRPPRVAILTAVIGTRLPVLLLGALAVTLVGTIPAPTAEALWRVSPNELANLQARWDTDFYYSIATTGYHWDPAVFLHQNVVFFPLYPLLMRWGGALLGGHPLVAGTIISLIAFGGAIGVLYRLAAHELGEDKAWPVILLLS